jgi:pimeloyl-ACP methyl ester carboxylesterase
VVYDVDGDSGTAVVLVHGWACRRSDWDGVIPVLAGEYRVVALDLPWHGASTSTREAWAVQELGAVVADVVDAEQLDDVVLVGHSMGGAVALEAAAMLGSRVRQVIGLDCFTQLFVYPRQDQQAVQTALGPFRSDFAQAVRGLVESVFAPDSEPELMDTIIAEMSSVPSQPAIAALEALCRWDQDAVLTNVSVPVSVLAARVSDEARQRYGRRIDIEQVSLGGHFFLREQPAAMASAISAQIMKLSPPPSQ